MTKKEIRHYVVCNLSYAATSALIETKLYSKVITNMVECFYDRQGLTSGLARLAFDSDLEVIFKHINSSKTLHMFLLRAFSWGGTPEGYIYWDNLASQYRKYAIHF